MSDQQPERHYNEHANRPSPRPLNPDTAGTLENPQWGFDTAQVHAGSRPDMSNRARVTPIYATTSYLYDSTEHAAEIFQYNDLGSFSYSRTGNPTSSVAERRIAELEGGTAAVAVGSGQAATTLALLNLCRTGDHIVSSEQLYGGTTGLFMYRFAELGIEVSFVKDIDDPQAWRDAVRPNTRAFFTETVANPSGAVSNLPMIADVAHDAGVPLVVDSTVSTPFLLRPFDFGADIVVHSTTKYLGGHGTVLGGMVVDSGRFDFGAEPEKWPALHELPYPNAQGSYWERFGHLKLAYALRLRTALLRDYGSGTSPFNSFLLLMGIETLSLRMRQHVANADAIVRYLLGRPEVREVFHPANPTSPWHEIGKEMMPRGTGAIVSFELKGGLEAGRRFVEGLSLFSHLVNIGDVRSLVVHPASTTHAELTPEQRANAGVPDGLIRLSIGIEDIADLTEDLDRGFAAAAQG